MPTCIIFHSYSGITRGIAEKIEKACGGSLIEVVPRKAYNKLTVYLAGGRAMKEAIRRPGKDRCRCL
jgi:flavodoxin